jgi:arsenite-transporting ATPase
VLSYATSADELAQRASMQPEVLVLDAALFAGPQVMAEALAKLSFAAIYVLLPAESAGRAEATALSVPSVLAVWKGEVRLSEMADTLYAEAIGRRTAAGRVQVPKAEPPPLSPHPTPQRGTERVIAFWSGPAGGAGRTTLALALAILAVEWRADAVLLGLSEPAMSAYLHLARVPNALTFLQGAERIEAVEQVVAWDKEDGAQASLPVILGPARPRDGAMIGGEQIGGLIEATRAAHDLVIVDLPPLTPGDNAWSLAPLGQASDVVLVVPPSPCGVAAAVEALVTLDDLGAKARVHVVLNRRVPGGLSERDVEAGVAQMSGAAPPVAVEVPFIAGLPGLLDRAELPAAEVLVEAAGLLVEVATGWRRPEPVEPEPKATPAGKARARRPERPARPREGRPRLIRIRLK